MIDLKALLKTWKNRWNSIGHGLTSSTFLEVAAGKSSNFGRPIRERSMRGRHAAALEAGPLRNLSHASLGVATPAPPFVLTRHPLLPSFPPSSLARKTPIMTL